MKRQVSPKEEDIRKLEKYLRGKNKARQLLVVMFTDLEGSTKLTEQKGDLWWDEIRTKIDKIAIPEIKKGGCLLKKIGDSYMAVFDSSSGAIKSSLELQAKMHKFTQNLPEAQGLKMRIGLHSGEVTVEAEKLIDIFGTNVNIASRVEGLAAGGQIYMTERVYQDAKSYEASLNRNLIWQNHDLYKLKGITLPQRIYEVIETQFGSPRPPVNGIKFPFYELRPLIDPNRIFGRKTELDEMDEKVASASAIAITGIRGIGKSTLASMWVERIEQKGKFVDIVWLPISEKTTILDVISGFFEAIGEPREYLKKLPVQNQVVSFLNKLSQQPYLIILDGFETIISPKTNQSEEPGFTELLHGFCRQIKDSRVVLTSWETPIGKYGVKPETFVIQGLDDESAIFFLHFLGVEGKDADLKEAIKRAGGHPIALQQLAQLVKGKRDLSDLLKRDDLWLGKKGEVAEKLLDEVYEKRLSPKERLLLKQTSIFRQPERIEALKAISEKNLEDVEKLAESLVNKTRLNLYRSLYSMHSLIQRNAYNKLKEAKKIKYHKRAVDYYLSIPMPERKKRKGKQDILPLLEAYYHACQAENYEQAFKLLRDDGLDDDLDLWGEYTTLIELCKGIPEKPFPLSSEEKKGNLLYALGNAYSGLSQFNKAIEYYKQALNIAKEMEIRENESCYFNVIGMIYIELGEFEKAIEYCKQGLDIARDIVSRKNENGALGNIGIAYSRLGEFEKAIEYLKQGLDIARTIEDRANEGHFLGNIAECYRDLGQYEKAIEYSQQALDIAKVIGDREAECAWLGNIGLAYDNLGKYNKAFEYYKQGLDIAIEIGDRQKEGLWLGSIGTTYYSLKQYDKTIEYYKQALDIAVEIGNRFFEGLWFNNLGEAYIEQAKYGLALSCFLQSQKIKTEIKNPTLKKAEENINKLKINLGQVKFQELLSKIKIKPS